MPCSIFRSYSILIQKLNVAFITIHLANKSIVYPKGTVDGIMVKVDKFEFLVDFVILYMEEDEELPLILGRSFFNMVKLW